MAAARDSAKSIVAAMRAHRHAAPIGLACGALIGGVMLLGNPFAASPPLLASQPEIRLGTAELSLPEPGPVPTPPKQSPAPIVRQVAAPVFVVPPAPAPTIPAATPPAAPAARKTKQMGGGKRATTIVETLPAKPIIPPFMPKQATGATPEPHPPLPLDTELGTSEAANPAPRPLPAPQSPSAPQPSPAPKTAAASLPRDG